MPLHFNKQKNVEPFKYLARVIQLLALVGVAPPKIVTCLHNGSFKQLYFKYFVTVLPLIYRFICLLCMYKITSVWLFDS